MKWWWISRYQGKKTSSLQSESRFNEIKVEMFINENEQNSTQHNLRKNIGKSLYQFMRERERKRVDRKSTLELCVFHKTII